MITAIELKNKVFEKYNKNEKLDGLSKINIFIGANNSGKSTFLRALFNDDYRFKVDKFDSDSLNKNILELQRKINEDVKPHYSSVISNIASHGVKDVDSYLKNVNATIVQDFYDFSIKELANRYLQSLTKMSENNIGYAGNVRERSINTPKAITEHFLKFVDIEYQNIKSIIEQFTEKDFQFKKFYIPILRGLLQINESENSNYDNYKQRVIKDYFTESNNPTENKKPNNFQSKDSLKEDREIFIGFELYNTIKKLLLGFSEDRNKVRKFEEFLSKSFYEGKEVNIVPKDGTDYLIIKIGEEELPIYKLGDGVQAIILLTYPLFFTKDNQSIFFIEEPETHLHPGLQRILIETLRSFDNYQYFITSHSNHFLDLSLEYDDISIFSFQKNIAENKVEFKITNVCDNHHQLLDELGVRNSSVFLANCTIWVEGITDRLYIRKFLEILKNDFKEDLHYAFIEYSGNNITHWSFLDDENTDINDDTKKINYEFISNKIFLIADKDNPKPNSAKSKRHKKLASVLADNFYLTKCLEFENMLSKKIIQVVIEEFEEKETNLNFDKFTRLKHENIKLGKFIDSNVEGIKKAYGSDSGAIKQKSEFCKTAISKINSQEDLSYEAKELTQKIIDFIKKSNSKESITKFEK